MKKLRVLRVCATDMFAKTALLPEIDHMISEGYSVDIAFPEDSVSSELIRQGYNIILIKNTRHISIVANINTLFDLYRLIKKGKYDVVHSHNHVIGVITRIAAKLAGTSKIIHSPHGFYFHENMFFLSYWFYHSIEKCIGWITDLIFIENSENLVMCEKTKLINMKRIFYMGGGIDLERFNGKPLSANMKSNLFSDLKIRSDVYPIIGITARITYEKGYAELINSIFELRKEYPKIHLLIVGAILKNERDKYYIELENMIKEYSLEQNVTITLKHNVEDFLRLMDIFTLPSYREGLPRSIKEAMAMNLPVVATNIRGCRNLVVEDQTGILVKPKNIKSLKIALKELIDDVDKCKRFGKAGRKIVVKEYDNRIVFDRMISGYRSLF